MSEAHPSLIKQLIAEFFGTFLLILIGDGAVAIATFTSAYDLLGVSIMWGFAVMLAVYSVGYISGGHFNPAVTVSLAAFAGFPVRKIVPYIAAQVLGALAGAATVYGMWQSMFAPTAAKLGLTIGGVGSEKLAGIFCDYYPKISTTTAFLTEIVLTGVLLAVILAVTTPKNTAVPGANLSPVFIGMTVIANVAIGGPLTASCMNPARDFGPRIMAYLAGFGTVAFPGPHGHEWWLYWIAPIAGGLIGSAIYRGISAE